MKNLIKYSGIALLMAMGFQAQAQDVDVLVVEDNDSKTLWDRSLPNYRYPDQRGVNTFEPNKDINLEEFEGVQVRLGGAFALQFQGLEQENESTLPVYELGKDFNLATANMTFDILLAKGVRVHLNTYLSSQHHPEAYVKGGYLQVDNLDFISEGLASGLMEHLRIKFGHMENNYGDAHFRRSDNAMALYNPFVGNYLMDSFTTEVGGEIYYFNDGWLGMVGFTNGKLNQSTSSEGHTSPSLLAKIGYDKQISEDFRFRLTGSLFHSNQSKNIYLYSGDRAGSRYYNVMSGSLPDGTAVGDGFRSGRINPDLKNEMTAFMINPFIKAGGLEFFGIYERAKGKYASETDERTWNQYAGELLYRFGADENFYLGARYNTVNGELKSGDDVKVNRFNIGGGWFMTKNILTKVEYVNQNYNDYPQADIHHEGQFNGFNVEAVISF
ncbi:hypothetical protein JRG66_08870 [Salinimicrobium tongyeongense]|uniref:Phosphate-selective porin O and P n=1 Tax=Salinimicrobium tongyeongense TaxID=2809707 RepID=A0ABY6NMU2_9FLAO|nr:hypothetical protein [Salinimicrobium tongyeongense]UZH54114.1 hypothetical protein JRG66_08870 [Salinimicrobium tongyeongense]